MVGVVVSGVVGGVVGGVVVGAVVGASVELGRVVSPGLKQVALSGGTQNP